MTHRALPLLLAAATLALAGCASAPVTPIQTGTGGSLAELRPSLALLATRWHQSLTPNGANAVSAEALSQAQRWPLDQARQFIDQLDTNGNGTLELSESIAWGTTETSLQTLRTKSIEPQFRRADANGDGQLSRREADRLTWRMEATGAPASPINVPITDGDFNDADAAGDENGSLSLTEFIPVGVRVSARALSTAPADVGRAQIGSWISTIPWSH